MQCARRGEEETGALMLGKRGWEWSGVIRRDSLQRMGTESAI